MALLMHDSVLVDDHSGWRLCHNRRHLEEYGLTDHGLTPVLTSADDTLLARHRGPEQRGGYLLGKGTQTETWVRSSDTTGVA